MSLNLQIWKLEAALSPICNLESHWYQHPPPEANSCPVSWMGGFWCPGVSLSIISWQAEAVNDGFSPRGMALLQTTSCSFLQPSIYCSSVCVHRGCVSVLVCVGSGLASFALTCVTGIGKPVNTQMETLVAKIRKCMSAQIDRYLKSHWCGCSRDRHAAETYRQTCHEIGEGSQQPPLLVKGVNMGHAFTSLSRLKCLSVKCGHSPQRPSKIACFVKSRFWHSSRRAGGRLESRLVQR